VQTLGGASAVPIPRRYKADPLKRSNNLAQVVKDIYDVERSALGISPQGDLSASLRFGPLGVKTRADQISHALTFKQALKMARDLRRDIYGWLYNYDWQEFRQDWPIIRCWIPLQFRLAVEQVLWEKGAPWSSLITGFKPANR